MKARKARRAAIRSGPCRGSKRPVSTRCDHARAVHRPWRSNDVGRRRERCEEDAGRRLRWREGLARPSATVQMSDHGPIGRALRPEPPPFSWIGRRRAPRSATKPCSPRPLHPRPRRPLLLPGPSPRRSGEVEEQEAPPRRTPRDRAMFDASSIAAPVPGREARRRLRRRPGRAVESLAADQLRPGAAPLRERMLDAARPPAASPRRARRPGGSHGAVAAVARSDAARSRPRSLGVGEGASARSPARRPRRSGRIQICSRCTGSVLRRVDLAVRDAGAGGHALHVAGRDRRSRCPCCPGARSAPASDVGDDLHVGVRMASGSPSPARRGPR